MSAGEIVPSLLVVSPSLRSFGKDLNGRSTLLGPLGPPRESLCVFLEFTNSIQEEFLEDD